MEFNYFKIRRASKLSLHFSTVLLSLVASFLFSLSAISQNLGVNPTGTPPDVNAGLDVDFNDKGVLIPRLTTAERDAIQNPTNSLLIFNTQTECFEAWSSDVVTWISFGCIGCSSLPPVTTATAGSDQNVSCGDDFTTLSGNTPSVGTGVWTVVSGIATLTSPSSPTSGVTGLAIPGTATLRWTISNPCGSSYDDVVITSTPMATTAAAGSDQNVNCGDDFTTLAGNTPVVGTGTWTVVSGTANITSPTSPTSGVTGLAVPGTATLRWTISNACGSSYDDVVITTALPVTTATAGADQNVNCGDDFTTLAGNTPVVGTGIWTIVSGTANITSPTSPTSGVTGLAIPGTATLRWTISNSCGSSYDDVVITTCSIPFTCGTSSLTDSRDSKTYQTVQIGSQCWMKENLNYTPGSGNSWCYDNDPNNCTTYGRLYDWNAAMSNASSSNSNPSGVQGACATGWHIPSDAEWCQMENEVEPGIDANCNGTAWRGTSVGKNLKAVSPTWDGNDTKGFTALPAGLQNGGSFSNMGTLTLFWSATDSGSDAWRRNLSSTKDGSSRLTNAKTRGFSVRCVKDCMTPPVPTPGAGTNIGETDFDANWSASNGATGYYLDVATDVSFTTFVSGFNNFDVGNVITYNVTGLTCGTTYYYRVRSKNACGTSVSSSTITVTAGACCGNYTVTFTYKGSSVTYGTVSGQNGTCWMDRNLGASQVAVSSTDASAYGDLFQWGREDDGHQDRNSGTTGSTSSTDSPGHGNFITYGSSPYDWRNPQNDNLWQGVNGINNVCPTGWRVPTETELDNERASWSSQNAAGAFGSPLKLPVAGTRSSSNGSLYYVGSIGYYWSSTVSGTFARNLYFLSGGAYMNDNHRARGYSVRCIKD